MRITLACVVWSLPLILAPVADDDEKPDPLLMLKERARKNWEGMEGGPVVFAGTAHALLVAPADLEGRLKEIGQLIEKQHDLAAKTLFPGKNEVAFQGRVTIYLLPRPELMDSFVRRVEKRRPIGLEKGSLGSEDDNLFIAACPPRERTDPPVEVSAAQLVASLLLQRKAGNATVLPDWLRSGFGRATYYRVAGNTNRAVAADRREAARLARMRSAQDVWNGSTSAAESAVLGPGLADFLAYGPGRTKFLAVVEGFKPGENQDRKTMPQALQAAELSSDLVVTRFRDWLLRPN